MDGVSPVVLRTDASDYGIGAYLLQLREVDAVTRELPIVFLSKALNSTQCRWSTPEKEMYAIWYAVRKLNYLLGDISFVIETDHAN